MSNDDFGELRAGDVMRGESGESSAGGGATKAVFVLKNKSFWVNKWRRLNERKGHLRLLLLRSFLVRATISTASEGTVMFPISLRSTPLPFALPKPRPI